MISDPRCAAMPLFRQCCCCVTLQTGGVMMGVMTLAMSVFSIVPMSISLTNRCWLSIYLQYLQFIYNIYTNICRFYLARVIVYMLARYGRQEDESQQVTEEGHCALAVMQLCNFFYVKNISRLRSSRWSSGARCPTSSRRTGPSSSRPRTTRRWCGWPRPCSSSSSCASSC